MVGPFDPVNTTVPATPDAMQIANPDPALVSTPTYIFPGGGYLFNRSWLVSLAGASGVPQGFNSLRTVFEVEKTAYPQANKAKIQLYNINEFTRRNYFKGALISLSVGYNEILTPLLTNASPLQVVDERKGPDIITSFEIEESGMSLALSVINVPYPAGTTTTALVAQVVSAMGLVLGPSTGLIPKTAMSGGVLSGKCSDVLSRLLGPSLQWSVQGAVVQITQKGQPALPTVVPISEATGLLGSPNLGLGKGGTNTLIFSHLMTPLLLPGTAVALTSRFLTVSAIIMNATFDGDTHGNKWTVKCECNPIVPGNTAIAGT
jgi:hypothetical protein